MWPPVIETHSMRRSRISWASCGQLVPAQALEVGGALDGGEEGHGRRSGSMVVPPGRSASHPSASEGTCSSRPRSQRSGDSATTATNSCSQYTPPTRRVPSTARPPDRGARPPGGPGARPPAAPPRHPAARRRWTWPAPRPARPSCPARRSSRCSRARRRRSGRRARRPRRRRSSAATRAGSASAAIAAEGARGPDQRTGLAPMHRHELRQREHPPLRLEVEPLPADHALDAAGLEQHLAAMRPRPRGRQAQLGGRAGEHPGGHRDQQEAHAGGGRARRTGDGWWGARGGGRRRPCRAGRRGPASRRAPSRPRRRRRRSRATCRPASGTRPAPAPRAPACPASAARTPAPRRRGRRSRPGAARPSRRAARRCVRGRR